jgi:hypothetical protein
MYCSHIRCLSLLYVTNKNDYVIHPTIASFESKPHPNDKGSRRHVLRILQNALFFFFFFIEHEQKVVTWVAVIISDPNCSHRRRDPIAKKTSFICQKSKPQSKWRFLRLFKHKWKGRFPAVFALKGGYDTGKNAKYPLYLLIMQCVFLKYFLIKMMVFIFFSSIH